MKVALLEIYNFRGINSGKIQFRDHTVLIGPNNSGKTTIIEALALILGRDRLVRNLTEHDFFGSNPQAPDRIKIIATITGFDREDFTAHPEWFRDGRGVPTWFDPQTGNVFPERTRDDQPLACQIAFAPVSIRKAWKWKRLGIFTMAMTWTSSRRRASYGCRLS